MFSNLTHKLTISAAKSLLKIDDSSSLSTGKKLILVIAGAYILQRGIGSLSRRPFLGLQEAFLGGLLIYNAATANDKPLDAELKKVSDVRKNQIQGNDPDSAVPAFV